MIMNERRRGGSEIVEGLLIAFVGAPVVGAIVAGFFMWLTVDFAPVFTLVAFATFAYGAIRAGRGARAYLDNVETAALLTIRDAEAAWDERREA